MRPAPQRDLRVRYTPLSGAALGSKSVRIVGGGAGAAVFLQAGLLDKAQ